LIAQSRRAAIGACVVGLIVRAGNVSAGPASHSARLVSSGAGFVSFEVVCSGARVVPAGDGTVRVLIDGFGTFSPPGAVELPGRTFHVAIPPEGNPRISVSVIEEESFGRLALSRVFGERLVEGEDGFPTGERYLPPDPWREGGAPPLASALEPSFMGRQRVLPVRINPLSVDERGEARLARRIAVTVSFERWRGTSGTAEGVSEPLSGAWKRLYDGLLVNPADAAAYRLPLAGSRVSAGAALEGKRLKLRIPETGLYVMRADSLISAGLSPGLVPGEIALRKHYYDPAAPGFLRAVDVPILIVESEGGSEGVFEGADRLYFYALGLKDDAEAGDPDALYTDNNVLWLEEGSAGASMSPGIPLSSVSEIPVTTHRVVKRERKDTAFMKNAVPGTFDFYFLKGYDVREYALPFTLHEPAPEGVWSLTIRIQGGDGLGLPHTLSFRIRNGSGTNLIGTGGFNAKQARTFTFANLPASWLANGTNELLVTCDADYKHLVNDFTVEYPGRFVARNNALEFTLDPLVVIAGIEITGFTVSSGRLVELTDPRHPVYRELGPSDFAADGAGWKLVLNIEESMSTRRFAALGAAAGTTLPVRSVSVDAPSALRATAGRFHTLVISHGEFLQRIGEYADWRRGQGYRVFVADVENVFDEYNGGLPHAAAIKRFIKDAFDRWGVEYVLLVGDASEDHKRVYTAPAGEKRGSPPDYVPSYSYVTSVTGTYDDETVCSDKWYAFLDGNPGPDPYPDVFVGRFPVGRDVELRAILNKLYRAETAAPEDAWRRRIVLFADDAWSGGGSDYRYRPYEGEFQWSTDSCGAVVERSLPGGFEINRLYLAPYTDPAHPDPAEAGAAVFSRAREATRRTFTPALVGALNRGCLIHMFQGHANRAVLTTEQAFSLQIYGDIDSLRTAIPFVFAGFGCHISDFAVWQEYSYATYVGGDGDCMSEQLLFKPGGGAISTYASDGFEYLSQNSVLVVRFFKNFFQRPPVDSVAPGYEYTGAHWILGELVTRTEIEQIGQTVYGLDQIMRYHLLGDPMLRVDPGPPLMRLEADWGGGFEPLGAEGLRARNGTNDATLRLTASDVVAIGPAALSIDGVSWTDSLEITPLRDADRTFYRSYRADVRYTVDPADELLVWTVAAPDGREAGRLEVAVVTRLRLFYNDYLEILPGVESPPTGTFTITAEFPAYLREPPALSIDGLREDGVHFRVPDPADSLRWEASFERTLPAGTRVFTIRAGEFSRDIVFTVTGDELVADAFNFPNPFRGETNIVYSLNLAADAGRINIYNVSGILVRSFVLTPHQLRAASFVSPHSIVWDGRDLVGDRVANGTYIYVLRIERGGRSVDITGKSVKLE
jgi:hypothetical protein